MKNPDNGRRPHRARDLPLLAQRLDFGVGQVAADDVGDRVAEVVRLKDAPVSSHDLLELLHY